MDSDSKPQSLICVVIPPQLVFGVISSMRIARRGGRRERHFGLDAMKQLYEEGPKTLLGVIELPKK